MFGPTDASPGQKWLNLELSNSVGKPLGEYRYTLVLSDGSERAGVLDASGRLIEAVPEGTELLTLRVANRTFELNVKDTSAAGTVAGAQERLNQLNYFVGKVDGAAGDFTRASLRRFQRDQKLTVNGQLDVATAERLEKEQRS